MSEPLFEPVAELQSRAAELVARVKHDHVPVILTEGGQSTAVLLDAETYQELLQRVDVLEGLARGERALSEGRVVPHSEARRRLSRWLIEK